MRPVRKRKLVDEMRREWAVSIRRSSQVFLLDTSTYHYKSTRAGQAILRKRIREIAETRIAQVEALARTHEYPLRCSMDEA